MLVRTVKVGGGFAVGDWSIRLLDVRPSVRDVKLVDVKLAGPEVTLFASLAAESTLTLPGGIDVRVWEIRNSGVKVGVGAPACVKIEVERPIDDESSRVGCLG
jgi:hypothetical protein